MVHGIGPTGPVEGPKEPNKSDLTRALSWQSLQPSQQVLRSEFTALKEAIALIGIYSERFKRTT